MTQILLVLFRSLHFASCLTLLGTWACDRFVVARLATFSLLAVSWRIIVRRLNWMALSLALLSGAGWMACVVANMSGLPLGQALSSNIVARVWNQTTFGATWKWRLTCWCVMTLLTGIGAWPRWSARASVAVAWCSLICSGVFAATLAWSGHGLAGSIWHRAADVLHLLAAGVWPGGLLPFFCLLYAMRRPASAPRSRLFWALTSRFSLMSLITVTILLATGIANAWVLVGTPGALVFTAYGRWLFAKVVLFVLMVALGACNLLRWRPKLPDRPIAIDWIRTNIAIELLLAAIVIVLVAILGLLSFPAN